MISALLLTAVLSLENSHGGEVRRVYSNGHGLCSAPLVLDPGREAELGKAVAFFSEKILPDIKKRYGLVPHSDLTLCFEDWSKITPKEKPHGPHQGHGAFFSPSRGEHTILLNLARKDFGRSVVSDSTHELQHLLAHQEKLDFDWELNEGLSLLWQKELLGDYPKARIQKAIAGLADMKPNQFWDFSARDSSAYARLTVLFQWLENKLGPDNLTQKVYQERPTHLETVLDWSRLKKEEILAAIRYELSP